MLTGQGTDRTNPGYLTFCALNSKHPQQIFFLRYRFQSSGIDLPTVGAGLFFAESCYELGDSMFQSIAMTFSKYFDFKSRATRTEFWTFYIFTFVVLFALGLIEGILIGIGLSNFTGLANLAYLIQFIPSISCAVRRVRDTGKNVWFVLFPIVNFILLFFPSSPQETDEE